MRILVVGAGAREDALSWRLAQSASCDAIYAAPGNAGTATRGENWPVAVTEARTLVERAKEAAIDLVVIGPETAIAAGVGDRFRDANIAVFGPNHGIGRLESSKVFAKRFMREAGIPTAQFRVAHTQAAAVRELDRWKGACVVKADGLAAGKGVVVCDSAGEAREVVDLWYAHGIPGGGTDVVLEERLAGQEVSVFALCDGTQILPVTAACDYKRAYDGDAGPNTGGMGAYSPPVDFPKDLLQRVGASICAPLEAALERAHERYIGVLYIGLMWSSGGPRVLEFNVRFGDPETQALMPRVTGDFAKLVRSVADGRLDPQAAAFDGPASVAVVLASEEYPSNSAPLSGLPLDLELPGDAVAFWGGSSRHGDRVDSSGGRVLTIADRGSDIAEARSNAYNAVTRAMQQLRAPLRYREDIAAVAEPTRTLA